MMVTKGEMELSVNGSEEEVRRIVKVSEVDKVDSRLMSTNRGIAQSIQPLIRK